ncbi:hypothetical protein [Paenibacillus aquistagni]|nr:hypothetical protein [Paenibacillus aquistagni]NMM51097.1 hypothetical protein [Paenibacillus aquistagni]
MKIAFSKLAATLLKGLLIVVLSLFGLICIFAVIMSLSLWYMEVGHR